MELSPMDSAVGDSIALLEGGRVPYVLRAKPGMENGPYEIIGDAYIHGITNGEAWNPELCREIVLV